VLGYGAWCWYGRMSELPRAEAGLLFCSGLQSLDNSDFHEYIDSYDTQGNVLTVRYDDEVFSGLWFEKPKDYPIPIG